MQGGGRGRVKSHLLNYFRSYYQLPGYVFGWCPSGVCYILTLRAARLYE